MGMAEEKTRFEPRVRPGSKFSPQTRERAVRLVFEHGSEFPNERRAIQAIADKFGMHRETLRRWVLESRIESGDVDPTDEKDRRIKELEGEVADLEQTVEVLKAATSFFAREYDPQQRRSADS
jgi:transposase